MKYCTKCGAECGDEEKFCTNCGAKLEPAPAPKKMEGEIPPPGNDNDSQKKKVPVWVIVLIVALIVVAAVLATVLVMQNKQKAEVESTTGASSVAVTQGAPSATSNDGGNYQYPTEDQLIQPYEASVECTDKVEQDYVKLRNGPSKSDGNFDVVRNSRGDELHIPDGDYVTVMSKPVSYSKNTPWVFVKYTDQYGNSYQGWMRYAFVHVQ